MSCQEFLDKILEMMKGAYPDCNVEIVNITKNNNTLLHGLIIRQRDTNVAPTIYLEEFYKMYKSNVGLEVIVSRIKELYEKGMSKGNIDMSFFKDFEKVKDRIVYRLINAELNQDYLKEVPHIPFWDLAICFSYVFQSEELGDGVVHINNSHAEYWNVDCKCLMKWAEINTPKLFPICLCDVLAGPEKLINQTDEDIDMDLIEDGKLYVMTNNEIKYGAATMLYPQILGNIAEKLQKDFFILPSSLHEILILSVREGEDIQEQSGMLRELIIEINETQVAEDEVLSNNPFLYSWKKKELIQL